jgi:hypothetical protein
VTRTVTVERAAGIPAAVERARRAVERAAESRDWEALERLARPPFKYSFGPDVPGGAVAYWKQLEATTDEKPLETLAAILKLPYTLSHGLYVWPFAYTTPPDELTPYERRLLAPIADAQEIFGWAQFGGYNDWRAGFAPDGRWQFYVAGD